MDIWRDIRLKARQRHNEAAAAASNTAADALVKSGLKIAKLQVDKFEPGTVFGPEVLGVLEREDGFVRLASNLEPRQRAVVAAHELGHYWLHDETAFMVRSTEAGFGGQPIETGSERVVAYSPRERQEIQADIFAQEFLLPANVLHEQLVGYRKKPSKIAEETGLPIEFVKMQAIRALLLPPLTAPVISDGSGTSHPLDPEQREAAEWDECPLILDAGPGTGKTRTLISRIKHLIDKKVSPSTILALTYSNKAAAEMVERVEIVSPAAAPLIWVGTFHAFGLELLRQYYQPASLPSDFKVLDETMALALLEGHLAELSLVYFQNLWDPTIELKPILRAISRAKDEMVSAQDYMAAALADLKDAVSPEEVERAEKAIEVGRVYQIYQKALIESESVDFGDLVYRSAELLASNPTIRDDVRIKHRYVLVDEYQDVNFASTSLLEQITDKGRRLWVVADPRQSIYRFRGAAPANTVEFTSRYPGAQRRQLKTNYRSCETIVRVFERFGATIAAAPKPAVSWKAHRGKVGFVELVQAPDLQSEAVAMRDQIERLKNDGIGYEDQAILAGTHLSLARFGRILQDLGVPILYLGDLFERPEIRDLLALISLGAEPSGIGLVRVAQFPEYGATREDAVRIIGYARQTGEDILAVCAKANIITGVTLAGASGLQLLSSHLHGNEWKTSAWNLLSGYLLESSNYLQSLLDAGDIRSQQSLVAIYQFLKFCREHFDVNRGVGGRRKLLDDIRRLERLDDDRQFRIIPPEAAGIDAVRMMTIHGSKGLEFPAVHLPQVATYYVPARRLPVTCPVPKSLERLEVSPAEHKAEMECLFFVALSRARDVLTISSAKHYTAKRNCNPSKFLDGLGGVLPRTRTVNLSPESSEKPTRLHMTPEVKFEERHLQIYGKCPARYRYEVVDGLTGHGDDNAYLKFHTCVRKTIRWIYDEFGNGRTVTVQQAIAQLRIVWADQGPNHAFEPLYLVEATKIVEGVATMPMSGVDSERTWIADLSGKQITMRPDRVLMTPSGSVVAQRIMTGRKTKSESDKPIWELMQLAGQQMFPDRKIELEVFYPAQLEHAAIVSEGNKGLEGYAASIAGIESGMFSPSASRDCPTCQFYFICTSEDFF
jgi:superfamily I DNA/RNA helicase/Zn-dependent peptidase ImmA (M78 family)